MSKISSELPTRLYSADQIGSLENIVIKELGINSYDLMLLAGASVFTTIKRRYPQTSKLIVFVGGGSNAAGIFYHYLENSKVNLIGVEAAGLGVSTNKSAATTKLGKKGVLHGSKTLLMQDENGQVTEPYSISAGLDYPGIGLSLIHI